jgi:DNA-binding NtrC family response regulator
MRKEQVKLVCDYIVGSSKGEPIDLRNVLSSIEAELIERALVSENGSRSKAAAGLGLLRTTLVMKVKKYGVENFMPPPPKETSRKTV